MRRGRQALRIAHTEAPLTAPQPTTGKKRSLSGGLRRKISPVEALEKVKDPGPTPSVTPVTESLRLGDEQGFVAFIEYTFSSITQAASKSILTAWINDAIHPKKQSTYPYAKDHDERRKDAVQFDPDRHPDWWPTRFQDGQTILDIPFIEPHHLRKEPRLKLAVHLTMLMSRERAEAIARSGSAGIGLDINHPWIDLLKRVTDPIARKLREDKDSDQKYNHRMAILEEFWKVAGCYEECRGGGLGRSFLHAEIVLVADVLLQGKTQS
jgi:hypothetical protein